MSKRLIVQRLSEDLTIESRRNIQWIPCQARNDTLYRYYDDTTLDEKRGAPGMVKLVVEDSMDVHLEFQP